MSAQLMPHQTTLPTIEPPSESVALMHIIEQAVTNKDLDVHKLEKLLDLKRQWDADEARKAFARALARFQARCPRISKTGRARVKMKSGGEYGYTFPKLDEIMKTIQPHLAACGLSISFTDFSVVDRVLSLACIVRHEGGHSESYPFAVPVDEGLSINKMQQVGVANSYCKRYALCNALSLVGTDEDTDGNHGHDEPATITNEQAMTLREYIEATNSDELAFLAHFELVSIEQMPARRFNAALNMLKQKERRMKEAQA